MSKKPNTKAAAGEQPSPAKAVDKNQYKALHSKLPAAYLAIFERHAVEEHENAVRLARAADEAVITPRAVLADAELCKAWKINLIDADDFTVTAADGILREMSNNLQSRANAHNEKVNEKFGVTAAKVSTYKEAAEPLPGAAVEGKRQKWNGFPITAVIRWMGNDGWNKNQAEQVLVALGFDVAPATIVAQLRAGKVGERGPAAELNSKQEKELNNLLK